MLKRKIRKKKKKKREETTSHGHLEARLVQIDASFIGTKGKENQFA